MKKILFFILAFVSLQAFGQSKIYLRGDSVQFERSGGNSELILLNGSRSVTNGILTNIGNGRTKFLPIDSFVVAVDTSLLVQANNGLSRDGGYFQLGGTFSKNTTITGVDFPLEITYNSLASGSGLKLTSTSTVNPSTTQRLLDVRLSGANTSGAGRESVAAYFENLHTYSGMGYSNSIGIKAMVGDTTDGNIRPYGAFIESKSSTIDAGGGAVYGEHFNDASSASGHGFGVKGVISGSPSLTSSNTDTVAAVVGIARGNYQTQGITSRQPGVYGAAVGNFTGTNAGGVFTASNGRKNYAIIAKSVPSSFVTTGDSINYAWVNIGAATTSFASLHIQEGVAPTSPNDGDMWHYADSLYFRSGSTTYNLTHAVEAGSIDFQTVLDNGSVLDKGNDIDQAGFLLNWIGPNRWYDSTATQVSIKDFNSGLDYLIYTSVLGDTIYSFTGDVDNGWKQTGSHDGSATTAFFQVKGNGLFGDMLPHSGDATEKMVVWDSTTNQFKTRAIPSGGSGANTTLSNLGTTAINSSLIPAATLTLGTNTDEWDDAYVNNYRSPGTMRFYINTTQIASFGTTALTALRTFVPRTGSTTAGTAPIKYASGSLMTAAEAGAVEYNGDFYLTKASNVRMGVGGTLVNNVTSVSTSGSSEVDLQTYSLPAATLDNDGDYIEVKTYFIANAAGQTIKVLFGATEVVSYTTTTSGGHWIEGVVTRTGAATQHALFAITANTASVTQETTPAETLSGAITIKGTGNAATLGNLSQTRLNVKYYPN